MTLRTLSVSSVALLFSVGMTACGGATASPGTPDSTTTPGDANGTTASPGNPNAANPNATPQLTVNANNTGHATFTGTVDGKTFAPKAALFAANTIPQGGSKVDAFMVLLSDQADACAQLKQKAYAKNSTDLLIVATDPNANLTTPDFASFSVQPSVTVDPNNSPANSATVAFNFYDATCQNTATPANSEATSGTVVLPPRFSTFDGSATLQGQLMQLKVGAQGDAVSATFTAAWCPELLNIVSAPTQPVCQ